MNTYNVLLYDISTSKQWMQFRHESFQLWESQVSGYLLNKNKDFVVINRDGISIYGLGSYNRRPVKADKAQMMMVHCLDSTSYLKIDRMNYILFEFSNEQNKVISIMQ